jgi:hypothetical protein
MFDIIHLIWQIVNLNATVYVHVFFARSGYTADPNDPEFDEFSFTRSHRKYNEARKYLSISIQVCLISEWIACRNCHLSTKAQN